MSAQVITMATIVAIVALVRSSAFWLDFAAQWTWNNGLSVDEVSARC